MSSTRHQLLAYSPSFIFGAIQISELAIEKARAIPASAATINNFAFLRHQIGISPNKGLTSGTSSVRTLVFLGKPFGAAGLSDLRPPWSYSSYFEPKNFRIDLSGQSYCRLNSIFQMIKSLRTLNDPLSTHRYTLELKYKINVNWWQISYSKIGSMYGTLGDNEKALK